MRDLLIDVLRAAPGGTVPEGRVLAKMHRELRRRGVKARDPPGCIRDCVTLAAVLPCRCAR